MKEFLFEIVQCSNRFSMADNVAIKGKTHWQGLRDKHVSSQGAAALLSKGEAKKYGSAPAPFGRNNREIPESQIRRAKLAYSFLFIFMVFAWAAILIGAIFSLRANTHDCEKCSDPRFCRSTTPAWGGEIIEQCLNLKDVEI